MITSVLFCSPCFIAELSEWITGKSINPLGPKENAFHNMSSGDLYNRCVSEVLSSSSALDVDTNLLSCHSILSAPSSGSPSKCLLTWSSKVIPGEHPSKVMTVV